MVTKKEKTEAEKKKEIFQKAYADANALLSRQFYQNYVSLIFVFFWGGGKWFSKNLCNIWEWYV